MYVEIKDGGVFVHKIQHEDPDDVIVEEIVENFAKYNNMRIVKEIGLVKRIVDTTMLVLLIIMNSRLSLLECLTLLWFAAEVSSVATLIGGTTMDIKHILRKVFTNMLSPLDSLTASIYIAFKNVPFMKIKTENNTITLKRCSRSEFITFMNSTDDINNDNDN